MKENKEKLIYDLIFSNEEKFKIDISEYIEDIYNYESFVSDIKLVLKKSKVKILENEIKLNSKTVIWKLKVKK